MSMTRESSLLRSEQMFPWVRAMAKMMARQLTISKLTGIGTPTVRAIWFETNGRSSPSGMTPSDLDWYLRNSTLRYQSALLLMLHAEAAKQLPKEIAFASAYYHFANMTSGEWERKRSFDGAFRSTEDDYVLSFARGHFLCNTFTDQTHPDGRRLCRLKLRRCKCCGGIYLSTVDEAGGKCPECN